MDGKMKPNRDTTGENRHATADVPLAILRLEGAGVLAAASLAYAHADQGWLLFALLFLAPDLALAGYAAGPRAGALLYNVAHSTLLPLLTVGAGLATAMPLPSAVGLIWLAHIGFDRALGFGLKYSDHFNHTHLGATSRKGASRHLEIRGTESEADAVSSQQQPSHDGPIQTIIERSLESNPHHGKKHEKPCHSCARRCSRSP